ncbi:pyrroloquinoline quinone biosynthesis peptide chaperone PqqD [Aurantivibrio infirmus]
MANFDLETSRFSINPRFQFQWEEAQQCHVLLYPEGLIKLGGSAAEIIQRCVKATTLQQLIEELQQTFPDAEGIAQDVKEFLADAQQQDWITESKR